MNNKHLNLFEKFNTIAKAIPDAECMVMGNRRYTYGETNKRCNALANLFLANGIKRENRVAVMNRNSPEFLEAYMAAGKIGCVPCNFNYKYKEDELKYLLEDSGAHSLVIHEDFLPILKNVVDDAKELKLIVVIGNDTGGLKNAVLYKSIEEFMNKPLEFDWESSNNDDVQWMLYTGGTTGYPKGTLWDKQFWEFGYLLQGAGIKSLMKKLQHAPPEFFAPPDGEKKTILHKFTMSSLFSKIIARKGVQDLGAKLAVKSLQKNFSGLLPDITKIAKKKYKNGVLETAVIASPLMHGTGYLGSISHITQGSKLVFPEETSFKPEEIWTLVEKEKATTLVIVGDAFAGPLARELGKNSYKTSHLKIILSSGVVFSPVHKEILTKYNPRVVILDSLGASEGLSRAEPSIISDSGETLRSMSFDLAPHIKVFDKDDNEVQPGSDVIGQLGVSGPIPRGYWRDEKKTNATFREIRGTRYAIFGDFCKVDEKGSLILLGRGAFCINSGGEKIYPEEVEKVLKELPHIDDCCVLGVPDKKWGEAVTAMVSMVKGQEIEENAMIEHCASKIARYKKPKKIYTVKEIPRLVNGKLNYAMAVKQMSDLSGVEIKFG